MLEIAVAENELYGSFGGRLHLFGHIPVQKCWCLVGLVAEVSTVLPARYVTGDVDVRAGVVLVRLHTAALLAHDLLPQKTLDNIFLGILDYNTNTSVYLISYSMLVCFYEVLTCLNTLEIIAEEVSTTLRGLDAVMGGDKVDLGVGLIRQGVGRIMDSKHFACSGC